MITIIGVDCATDPRKVGLCLARADGDRLVVDEVVRASRTHGPAQIVTNWIESKPVLLALDAPLGWPSALHAALARHEAGGALPDEADTLFHRQTDEFVKGLIHHAPLEVGANLIARTAHAALSFLKDVRTAMDLSIPLLWQPGELTGVGAIEVYPRATMTVAGVYLDGYKKDSGMRRTIMQNLSDIVVISPEKLELAVATDDALDALICALAGHDFVRQRVRQPIDRDCVKREGWIWVRT